MDEAWARNTANFSVYEKPDPDIKVPIESVTLDARKTIATLKFKDALNTSSEYIVEAKDVSSGGKILKGRVEFPVKKGEAQVLFGIFLGAMLINNFVFTTVPGAVHLLRSLSEERRGHWHGDHLHHCHGR